MEGVKKRKSSITINNSNHNTSSLLYNPFSSYDRGSFSLKGKHIPVCDTSSDNLMNISDSSLGSADHSDCSNHTKSLYAVKVLSILLVGFAAGLLYHLIVSSSSSWASTTHNQAAAGALVLDEDMEFLTDELVKKLAAQNQMQEHEIEELKRQVKAQQQQREKEERLLEQQRAEEEASRRRQEEDERQIQMQQRQQHDNLYVPPQDIISKVDPPLYLQQYHKHHPQPVEPIQGYIYVPEREWHADEPIYLQQYHKNHAANHPTKQPQNKPKRVFDMSDPAVAQAHIVGHLDQNTGEFVHEGDHTNHNLRGGT